MAKQNVVDSFEKEINDFSNFLDEHTACKVIDLTNVHYRQEVSINQALDVRFPVINVLSPDRF